MEIVLYGDIFTTGYLRFSIWLIILYTLKYLSNHYGKITHWFIFNNEFLKVGHINRSYFQDLLFVIWSYVIYSTMPLNLVKGNKEQI